MIFWVAIDILKEQKNKQRSFRAYSASDYFPLSYVFVNIIIEMLKVKSSV